MPENRTVEIVAGPTDVQINQSWSKKEPVSFYLGDDTVVDGVIIHVEAKGDYPNEYWLVLKINTETGIRSIPWYAPFGGYGEMIAT